MNSSCFEIERSVFIPGVFDRPILQQEIEQQRAELDQRRAQLALERDLTNAIFNARAEALTEYPALRRVYELAHGHHSRHDEKSKKEEESMAVRISQAFGKDVASPGIDNGFIKQLGKVLRREAHPDNGGDTEGAKIVGETMDKVTEDPLFALVNAVHLANRDLNVYDHQALLDERYRNTILLQYATSVFSSEQEAQEHAAAEIASLPWKMRVDAAFASLDLLTGGIEVFEQFIRGLVDTRHFPLIDKMNDVVPKIRVLQERILKGEPLSKDAFDAKRVDEVLFRIWDQLADPDSTLPYSPPYQNWLEILLEVFECLDPGEKEGESYAFFGPIVAIISESVTYSQSPVSKSEYDLGPGHIIQSSKIYDQTSYSSYINKY